MSCHWHEKSIEERVMNRTKRGHSMPVQNGLEELHITRYEERMWSFPALSKGTILSAPPHINQPRRSLNPILWVFMEASLQRYD